MGELAQVSELKLFKGTIGHWVYTYQGRTGIKDVIKTPLQTTETERFGFLDTERETLPN